MVAVSHDDDAATADDLATARETVGLITDRGYARGRDLKTALELLTEH